MANKKYLGTEAMESILQILHDELAKKADKSTGADYAEMFKWADNNVKNEDRTNLFVTLDGDKIKIANSEDDFILGIVSTNPTVIGDEYDKNKRSRLASRAWSPIGLLGKLYVKQDGSAILNGYVTSGDNGIAINSEEKTKFRVIEVESNELIRVIMV